MNKPMVVLLASIVLGAFSGPVVHAQTRTLVAVGDYDYPPYTFLEKTEDKPCGHDVDIVNQIAEELGTKIEIRLLKWDEAQASVERGEADFIISILHSREREKRFDFTIPYQSEYYAIFVNRRSSIRDLSDLEGKEIIALKGDASIDNFIKPMGLYDLAVFVDSLPIAIDLLNSGKHDFVLAPYRIGMDIIKENNFDNVKFVGSPILPSLYRLAVKKGNAELLAQLNEAIDLVKISPEYDELNRIWFKYQRDEELSTALFIKYAACAGVPVITIIFLLVLWSWSLKRKVDARTRALKEKEVHYRIKNNISSVESLLMLQADSTDNPEAVSILQDAIARIQGMRLIYDKLLIMGDYWELSVKDYLCDLISTVIDIFPNRDMVIIRKEIENFNLDVGRLQPLGLIVNELLTNVMKYAFSGRDSGLIRISLIKSEDTITLTVHDSGVGLPADFDLSKSRGLMLVTLLARQLGGTFTISNDNGTRSVIEFSLPRTI